MKNKTCGQCRHWHPAPVPKGKDGVYKNGRCGLGFRNDDEVTDCRVFKDKEAKEEDKRPLDARNPKSEAAKLTGMPYGHFTSNPWEAWRKR